MSYIEDKLFSRNEITNFLLSEGFHNGRNPVGHGNCLLYVARGQHVVWFSVFEDYIHVYVEYACGGEKAQCSFPFEKNNTESFMESYKNAIEWNRNYI